MEDNERLEVTLRQFLEVLLSRINNNLAQSGSTELNISIKISAKPDK